MADGSARLEALVATTLRERIARWARKGIGEENTKTVLIEPVLRALGWDVEDLDEVRKEYRTAPRDNPVDYALLLVRMPRLFVEAKALGENLADRRWASQIMGYAGVAGVEWVVLTDGNEYRIYNAHAPVDFDAKLFRRVVVASDDPGVAGTLALLSKDQLREAVIDQLWRAEFVDRQVRAALEGLFGHEVPGELIELLQTRAPKLSLADLRASLGRLQATFDFPLVTPPSPPPPEPEPPATLARLVEAGLIRLPLELEHHFRGGVRVTARLEALDRVVFDGQPYDSLSTAGGMARKSVSDAPPGRAYPQTNGWDFWRIRQADGSLVTLDALRRELHEGKVVRIQERRPGA